MTECQCIHMHWGLRFSYGKVPVWSCDLGTEYLRRMAQMVLPMSKRDSFKVEISLYLIIDNKKDKEILVMGERKRKIYKREGLRVHRICLLR